MLFLALFIFFLILSGKLSLEIVAVGLVLSGAVDFFACRFFGWSREKDRTLARQTGTILRYCPKLFWEIIKANIAVLRLILRPGRLPQPCIFSFDSQLKSDIARTVLADSITITPGTITLAVRDRMLTVHALDKAFAFGSGELCFQRDLMAAEAKEERHA